MRRRERFSELIKRAILKSVATLEFILTIYTNLKYFKVSRSYSFMYINFIIIFIFIIFRLLKLFSEF